MSGIIRKPVQRRICNWKDFFIFAFYIELSRFKNLWIGDDFLLLFTFSLFFTKFSSILLKYVKIVNGSEIDFTVFELFDPGFLPRIYAKFLKIQTFFVKNGTKYVFLAQFL